MRNVSNTAKLMLAGGLLGLFAGAQLARVQGDFFLRWGVLLLGGVLLLFGIHIAVTDVRTARRREAQGPPDAAPTPPEAPVPNAPEAPAPPPPADIKQRLAHLKDLHDSRLITDDEYRDKKAELLKLL